MKENFRILSYTEKFCIVIDKDAKTYRPYVLKDGILFDPRFGFAPVNPQRRTRRLLEDVRKEAYDIIDRLKEGFEEELRLKAEQEQADVKVEEVKEEVKAEQGSPSSLLDALIAKSVAEISVGCVIDKAKPVIDEYIKSTYGMLPKVIEVKTEKEVRKVEGCTHKEFETILKLVGADIPVFLSGPAGCGKNVICKQVAEALGLEFFFTNAVTQEYKLTGFIDANGRYHETQFYKAFTEGGVFMLDEIDASTPEVLVILNAAIANRYFDFPTGRVTAHEDFRIVAAGNTFGTGADVEYTGRYQLDASSLDRFAIIEVDYDKDVESSIAGGDKEILDFVYTLRKAIKDADLKFTVSYRAIERLGKLKDLLSVDRAIKIAVMRSMGLDDARMIAENIKNASGNLYCRTFVNMVA